MLVVWKLSTGIDIMHLKIIIFKIKIAALEKVAPQEQN